MSCDAVERQFCSALTGNDIDDGEWKVEILENRTLLDVELEIAEGAVRRLRVRNAVGIEAEMPYRVAQRAAGLVGAIEQRRVEGAGKRAAAEKRNAEPHPFLVRKSDDLDRKWKPFLSEQLDQRNGEHRSEHAIEGTGVGDRIEMRSDVKPRRPPATGTGDSRGGYTPRMLPMASTRTVMPTRAIHAASAVCTSRIGLERNVRVMALRSSESFASWRHQRITSRACSSDVIF